MKAVTRLSSDMRGKILVSAGSKPYVSVKVDSGEDTIKTLKSALMILTLGARS